MIFLVLESALHFTMNGLDFTWKGSGSDKQGGGYWVVILYLFEKLNFEESNQGVHLHYSRLYLMNGFLKTNRETLDPINRGQHLSYSIKVSKGGAPMLQWIYSLYGFGKSDIIIS